MLSFDGGEAKKKKGAAKASRHKKKYWRRGTDITDFEDTLASISIQKRRGGIVSEKEDGELFAIDREPANEGEAGGKSKFTKKQQAVLDKISKRILDDEPISLPSPKFPSKQSRLRQPLTVHPGEKRVAAAKKKQQGADVKLFDLWETELQKKADIGPSCSEAEQHLMRSTKMKLPKLPPTRKLPPSLLPAVSIVNEGASYNPAPEDYQKYVESIVSKELKVMKEDQKIQRGLKPQTEKIVTYKERQLEMTEGLLTDSHYEENVKDEMQELEEKEAESVETLESTEKQNKKNELTKRERQKKKDKQKRLEKEEKLRMKKKLIQKESNNVFKAKQIQKALAEEEKAIAERAADRAQKKLLDKLTKRQRLGRGTLEEEEEPFLLQEELPSNLRSLKLQGNILSERVKSLKMRNILPVAGERNKRRLPKKLKAKFVEKRDVRETDWNPKSKGVTKNKKKKNK